MGYTHYYYQKRSFTIKEWTKILAEVTKIFAAASQKTIVLAGWNGEGFPVADSEQISFNGLDEMAHETFLLRKEKPFNPEWRKNESDYFSFCKTARKPYDAAVVSVLHAAREIAPDAIEVSSDGGQSAIRREL